MLQCDAGYRHRGRATLHLQSRGFPWKVRVMPSGANGLFLSFVACVFGVKHVNAVFLMF